MTFFHFGLPQKSRGFSGLSNAASSGDHSIHSLLGEEVTPEQHRELVHAGMSDSPSKTA